MERSRISAARASRSARPKTVQLGILRTIDDDEPGALAQARAHLVPIDGEGRRAQRNANASAPSQPDGRLVGVVGGIEDDRLVAGAHHRLNRVVQPFGGPASDGDLGLGIDLDSVGGLDLPGDQLAQSDDAFHGRILVVPFGDGLDQRRRQVRIDRVVRESLADIESSFLERAA